MLIDDNDEDLALTKLLLERSKVTNPVITAGGGEEATELLRNSKPERLPFMVLCDVRMPQVDGLDVLKWVRSQPRLSGLYFAMHSGGDVPADRARARSLGADEYLVKFPTKTEIREIAALAEAKRKSSAPTSY